MSVGRQLHEREDKRQASCRLVVVVKARKITVEVNAAGTAGGICRLMLSRPRAMNGDAQHAIRSAVTRMPRVTLRCCHVAIVTVTRYAVIDGER